MASEELIFDNEEDMSNSGGNMKRPLSEHEDEIMETGDEKRHAGTGADVVFKVLCSTSRVGSVIGKGGEVINRMRSESGAKIRAEDFVQGCDERIIFISAQDMPDVDSCPSQMALWSVIEVILAQEHVEGAEEEQLTVRLLVHVSQVGAIIGKGGETINALRARTGANIRVLPKQDLPLCASRSEEVCQITGTWPQVRYAVEEVSAKLRDHPVKEKTARSAAGPIGGYRPIGVSPAAPRSAHHTPHVMEAGGVEVTYRFLVPSAKAGGVIGRGGDVIRRIREETGAKVKLLDALEECDWRVVLLSSVEDALSPFCGAQEALLRCFYCCVEDSVGSTSARMLVPPNYVGAVLGKGGAIITALRQDTGATIRVVGKDGRDEVPSCAEEDDEMIVVEGHVYSVDAALRGVTLRLRSQAMRNADHPPVSQTHMAAGHNTRLPKARNIQVDSSQVSNIVMRIASDQVGGIIGKGGANITQIRQISGANVRLKDAEGPGERELEISGTEQQCQSANNLVQAFLWKNAAGEATH